MQAIITVGIILGTLGLMLALTSSHREKNYPTAEERWSYMRGPENQDDRSVEERADENEVIDLRDGGDWEQSLPESND